MEIDSVVEAKLHRVFNLDQIITYASATGTIVISRREALSEMLQDEDAITALVSAAIAGESCDALLNRAVYKWILAALVKLEGQETSDE